MLVKISGLLTAVWALRGATMLCKFVLTIFAAKALTLSEFGAYGLLTAGVATAVYVLGLQFYVFNLREIASSNSPLAHTRFIRGQLRFHFTAYGLFAGIFILFSFVGDFSAVGYEWLRWLLPLAITEHFSQEGYRFLIAISRGYVANVIFFIRSGSWAIFWVVYASQNKTASFDQLCLFWLCGSAASVVATCYVLRRLPWSVAAREPLGWKWIKKGIRVSAVYMVIVLCYAVTQYVARYILNASIGANAVGIFYFFVSMATPVITFMETGPYALLQPGMLKARADGALQEYSKTLRIMSVSILAGAIILTVGVAGITILYIYSTGRAELNANIEVFAWVCCATILNCFSLIPQAHLFALGADKPILIVNVITTIIAVIVSCFAVPAWGVIGAGFTAVITGAAMLGLMTFFALNRRDMVQGLS